MSSLSTKQSSRTQSSDYTRTPARSLHVGAFIPSGPLGPWQDSWMSVSKHLAISTLIPIARSPKRPTPHCMDQKTFPCGLRTYPKNSLLGLRVGRYITHKRSPYGPLNTVSLPHQAWGSPPSPRGPAWSKAAFQTLFTAPGGPEVGFPAALKTCDLRGAQGNTKGHFQLRLPSATAWWSGGQSPLLPGDEQVPARCRPSSSSSALTP